MGSYLQTSVTKVALSEAKGGSLGAAVPGTFRLLAQEESRLLYTLLHSPRLNGLRVEL